MKLKVLLGAAAVCAVNVGSADAQVTPVIYYACVAKNGSVTIVPENTTCKQGSNLISWNQIGPKGDPGATGAQGPAGPAGPAGPQGPTGATGPAGTTGQFGTAGIVNDRNVPIPITSDEQGTVLPFPNLVVTTGPATVLIEYDLTVLAGIAGVGCNFASQLVVDGAKIGYATKRGLSNPGGTSVAGTLTVHEVHVIPSLPSGNHSVAAWLRAPFCNGYFIDPQPANYNYLVMRTDQAASIAAAAATRSKAVTTAPTIAVGRKMFPARTLK